MCKEGYFGPDCGTPCTPRDDSTGHFTCDEDGTIVCLPGYQNTTTNCVKEVVTPQPTRTEFLTPISAITIETFGMNTQTEALTTHSPTTDISQTAVMPTTPTSNVVVNTMNTYTTVSICGSDGDIVPIVAGGVAGGLVVLLLILIVNIVLVVVVIKIKYTKHYSNKQGNMLEGSYSKHQIENQYSNKSL